MLHSLLHVMNPKDAHSKLRILVYYRSHWFPCMRRLWASGGGAASDILSFFTLIKLQKFYYRTRKKITFFRKYPKSSLRASSPTNAYKLGTDPYLSLIDPHQVPQTLQYVPQTAQDSARFATVRPPGLLMMFIYRFIVNVFLFSYFIFAYFFNLAIWLVREPPVREHI